METVGLIPAAGHATRLRLKAGSKEAQPLRGRPVMEYLLERMAHAAADRVRVVVRPDKEDVVRIAERWGAEIVFGHPPSATASFALAAKGLSASDVVLFGFPDTVWSPADGFVALRTLVREGEDVALGVFDTPYTARSDVAHLGPSGRVVRIDVKPDHPATELVWACGAARAARFRELTGTEELGVALSRAAARNPIAAVRLGRVIDVGTPEAFSAADSDPVFGST